MNRDKRKIYLDPKQWIILGSKPKKYLLSEKAYQYATSKSEAEEITNRADNIGSMYRYGFKVEKILPMSKKDEIIYWNYEQAFQCRYCKSYKFSALDAEDHVCEEKDV
jgi:hypothetical protein|tara:strand:- start:1720 stop:2043 length:324 start_codon:yes stop_codon:yes gene_type:complete